MIGRLIGNYKVLEKIGEGGMGSVWRGVDIMLDREVAIKMLRPELANDPQIVERFRAEAVTLARLNHPSIATLYAFIRQGDDYFMVMEYVRGETLSRAISERGALDGDRAVALFCQALDGIHHAHQMGIIHRDIKPANVMLTENGSIKVMDFGIARALGASRMTRTGHLIGTLEYMAPELIQGAGGDMRSDIYALGILLYEMLTGHVPFEANSDYELMRAQVEAAPPPPRHFAPHVPLDIERALMRALAKRPDARFQNAAEFRAALVSHIAPTANLPSDAALADTAMLAVAGAASARLPHDLKATRLANSADPHLKPTRLASETNAGPVGQPPWQASSAPSAAFVSQSAALSMPPQSLDAAAQAPTAAQAPAANESARQRHNRFARLLAKLHWTHYAIFGVLLLMILSAPFLLVRNGDKPAALSPSPAPRSQPATPATPPPPATRQAPAPPPAASPPNNHQMVPPPSTGSVAPPATPPPRRRSTRRSTAPTQPPATPSTKQTDNESGKKTEEKKEEKKDDKRDEKKDDKKDEKKEKKGGLLQKLKKLNPFHRGDDKKNQ